MKPALLIAALLLSSCTLTLKSPVTQIEYKGAISEEGISITAKPPFWQWAVDFYNYLSS